MYKPHLGLLLKGSPDQVLNICYVTLMPIHFKNIIVEHLLEVGAPFESPLANISMYLFINTKQRKRLCF